LPVYLRFIDKSGTDLLYNLPNNVPIKLCNNKKTILAYIVKNDKLKKAYLDTRTISEITAYTKLAKEKTFCLTVSNVVKGNLFVDYQYVQEEHCVFQKKASVRFNDTECVELPSFDFGSEPNTPPIPMNTIIIK
jgi:hypothetical protein